MQKELASYGELTESKVNPSDLLHKKGHIFDWLPICPFNLKKINVKPTEHKSTEIIDQALKSTHIIIMCFIWDVQSGQGALLLGIITKYTHGAYGLNRPLEAIAELRQK